MTLTVKQAYEEAVLKLPPNEVRILLCDVLSCQATDLILREFQHLKPDEYTLFQRYVNERWARRPISHIIGYRWFYGYKFKVTSDVLDPRPETELLIEMAKTTHLNEPHRVLDLGTGSGCLLTTYLLEAPLATGVGVDISAGALDVARENAHNHGVSNRAEFKLSHWTDALSEIFDVILCNPPYIPMAEVQTLQAEVQRYEPHLALTAGETGLEAYDLLSKKIRSVLKPLSGRAFFEVGEGQAESVAKLFSYQNCETKIYNDLSGKQRCVEVRC